MRLKVFDYVIFDAYLYIALRGEILRIVFAPLFFSLKQMRTFTLLLSRIASHQLHWKILRVHQGLKLKSIIAFVSQQHQHHRLHIYAQ